MSGSDNQTPKSPKSSSGEKDKRVHEVKQIAANVYEIQFQKNGQKNSAPSHSSKAKPSSRVLKAEDLRYSFSESSSSVSPPKVNPYFPSTIASEIKPQDKSETRTQISSPNKPTFEKQSRETTVGDLKQNLNSLKEMHLRLRVMLKELEEFVQS